VHDAVQVRAVEIVEVLGDRVGAVEIVVPEEQARLEREPLGILAGVELVEIALDLVTPTALGLRARSCPCEEFAHALADSGGIHSYRLELSLLTDVKYSDIG